MNRWRAASLCLGLVLAHLLLAGCAGLPPRDAELPSRGLAEWASTRLGHVASMSLARAADAASPGVSAALSGFLLLPVAGDALQTRMALVRHAQQALDVQSFEFNGDATGRQLLDLMRAASERGVRIRLLVDDLHSDSAQEMLSSFAAFDNVQVRLFNPFARLRGSVLAKLMSSLDELDRVNHRMHNKMFAADNAFVVFGGRNVADSYFMRGEQRNFIDLDVLGAGPVVRELSAAFDEYWNSDHSYSIDTVVPSARSRGERQASFRELVAAANPPPLDTTASPRMRDHANAPAALDAGEPLRMTLGLAQVRVDPVDKARGTRIADRGGTVREFMGQQIRTARREVFAMSPYFVPGRFGMEVIRLLHARGVRLTVLTNSLAATDEPAVHNGYLRYRRPMLEAGVQLYELSPEFARQRNKLGSFGRSLGMLHAKLVVIDRSRLFVGSLNMDGRSERYNTEIGVLIESQALASDLLDFMDFESSSYRVRLSADTQRVQWVAGTGVNEQVSESEPEASLWRQFRARVLGALLPEDWL